MPDIKHKYNYIDTELDRDVLAANIRHNAQRYIQSKKNWRQPQIDAFIDSLNEYLAALDEGRLSTEVAGSVHDSAGILQNDPANFFDKRKGHITGEEADRFSERRKRKLKPGFYANREAATFIDQIAGALYRKGLEDAEEEEEKPEATKFGWASGLWKSFMKYLNPNGTPNLDAWLDKDAYDEETGKRGYANRAKYFSDYINTYINSLPEEMDFSDVGTGWTKDDYILALRNLQGQLARENGVNNDFYLMLDQLGSDSNEYMPYWTSDRKYGEEVDPDEADRKRLNDNINSIIDQQRSNYNANFFYGAGTPGVSAHGFKLNTKAKTQDEFKQSFYNAINDYNNDTRNPYLDPSAYGLRQSTGKEWAPYIEQLYKFEPDIFKTVGGNSEYNGFVYVPGSIDSQTGTVLGFDPKTRATGRLYLGDLDNEARQMYRSVIANDLLNSADEYGNPLYTKRGGVLYAKKGAKSDTSEADLENDAEYQKERAEYQAMIAQMGNGMGGDATGGQAAAQQGVYESSEGYDPGQGLYSSYGRMDAGGGYGGTYGYDKGLNYNTKSKYADFLTGYNNYQNEVAKVGQYDDERMQLSDQTRNDHGLSRPWEGEGSQYNTNLLDTTDKVRLASMAADIAAIINPEGWTSLGLSLGSDVANLYADLKDKNVSAGKAWGSFAANLGLSSLAIIPVVGGALGKGVGLASKMAKFAPKLGKVLITSGVIMALSNGNDILNSVNKLVSKKDGSVESKMTLDDWRNIYTGLSAVLGATNAIKSAKVSKTLNSKSKTGRQLVLAKNQEGEMKYLAFSGDDAAKIKKAAAEKNAKPIQELVDNYHVKGANGKYTNEKFTLVQDETAAREGWHGLGKREASSKFKPSSVIEETSAEALKNNAESIRQAGGFGSRRAYNMAMHAERYGYGTPYMYDVVEGRQKRRSRRTATAAPAAAAPAAAAPAAAAPATAAPANNLTNQDARLMGILREGEGGQVNPETIRSARQKLAVFQQGGIIKKKFR